MHLKKYASLFFLHIYFFTIFASHFSGYSFQRVGKLVFTQGVQPKMRRLCKKKDVCRIFVPASEKTCFHATSAAENAVFT